MFISVTNILTLLFLFVTLESILGFTSLGDLPTAFWWVVNFLVLFFAFLMKPQYYNRDEDDTPLLFVKLLLMWNIICVFRGVFVADNYWEWKNLIQTMFVLLIPYLSFLFINQDLIKKLISTWLKYMPYMVLFFIPLITMSDFVGRYLTPFLFLLIFLPLLTFRWKIISLTVFILIITTGLDARSMVIKFTVALTLGIAYYFKFTFWDKTIKIIHAGLIGLPVLLLFLGVTHSFNIFDMKSYSKTSYTSKDSQGKKEDLTADTRTFIYVETIESALKNNYLLEGRTPARGYDSPWFGRYVKYVLGTGKMERFASEVSILNIFTWNGLIGVVLYFLVFFHSSYLAVYRSNNYFIKIVGLFVAFRWTYAFVEDFSNFDLQYMFLWIFIAMGFSSSFRNITDEEFKSWIQDLLEKSKLFTLRS